MRYIPQKNILLVFKVYESSALIHSCSHKHSFDDPFIYL